METENFLVTDLTLEEQKAKNGGSIALFIAVMGAVIYLYNNKEALVEGFKEGYDSVRKP